MKAIDVSIYSGEITVDQWRQVKRDGYGLGIVGLFHGRTVNRYAGQQLGAAIQAGLNVAAYVLIAPWTGWNGAQQVAAGLAEAQAYRANLRFLAVDVEIDGVTGKMVRQALDAVVEMGHRPIIYTGGWWWQNRFNFSGYPLWAAQYPCSLPGEPENLLHTVELFGGWKRDNLVGWQYKGTTDLHGVNCDLNWFDEGFVKANEAQTQEEEMPGEWNWNWHKERVRRNFDCVRAAMLQLEVTWPLSDEEKAVLEATLRESDTNPEVEAWRELIDALADLEQAELSWRRASLGR